MPKDSVIWEEYSEINKMLKEMNGFKNKEVFDNLVGIRSCLNWLLRNDTKPSKVLREIYKNDFIWEDKK